MEMEKEKMLEKTGFQGSFSHVAVVVQDIEKTMKAYEQLLHAERPVLKQTGAPEDAKVVFMGKSTPTRAYQAFYDLNGLRVELLQPDEYPSTWKDILEEQGEGLHHIAYDVEDMDAMAKLLDAQGMPVIQTGNYRGGKYAYVDSRKQIGMMLELLQSVE